RARTDERADRERRRDAIVDADLRSRELEPDDAALELLAPADPQRLHARADADPRIELCGRREMPVGFGAGGPRQRVAVGRAAVGEAVQPAVESEREARRETVAERELATA